MLRGRPLPIAILLGVALAATIGIAAASSGLGQPDVPAGNAARVGDVLIPVGEDTGPNINLGKPFGEKGGGKGPQEPAGETEAGGAEGVGDFNHALAQAAIRQNLDTLPKPGSKEYTALRDQAMGDLLDIVWIQGEAKERGIAVSQRDIDDQLAQIKKQNFPTPASFRKFLRQSGFTPFDVEQRVRLQLLSQKIQEQVIGGVPKASGREVSKYYETNRVQFEQPASRDARLILNPDRSKVDAAKAALEKDSSDASFKKVAKKYSTDPATSSNGGLRPGITEGTTGDPALDQAVFSAPLKQLSGPVQTPSGYYLVYVTKSTAKKLQPLKAVQAQLAQQITSQHQQEAFQAFIEDYRTKWIDKTICAEGYVFERCDNSEAAVEHQEGAPFVIGTRPAAPGQVSGFGQPPAPGQPQGPHPPGADVAPQLPGAGGIPGLPPGVAPPGAGGAPPGAGAPPPGGPPPGAPPPPG